MKTSGWQRVLMIIVPFFLIVGIFELIGMIIVGIPVTDDGAAYTIYQELVMVAFRTVGVTILLILFVKFIDDERIIQSLKLNKGCSLFVFGLYSFATLFVLGILFFFLFLLGEIKFEGFKFDGFRLLASILLFILVAISEEFIMRGYVLKNLLQSFSNEIALLLSSVLFVLIHIFNPNLSWVALVNLFLAGIVLGLIYIITDSIWYPILVHFWWNFIQTHLGFKISGQDTYSLMQITIDTDNIINGGKFGIEGSILCIILSLIVSIFLYFVVRKKIRATEGANITAR